MKRFVLLLVVLSLLSGCRSYMMSHVKMSIDGGNWPQAAERLKRCARSEVASQNSQKPCSEKLDKISASGVQISDYLRRESSNPWLLYSLAIKLQLGELEEIYPGEKEVVFQQSFDGFGECAKKVDHNCMVQYGKMILSAEKDFAETDSAVKAAEYWLNLSARYGNNEAREELLRLGKEIPSPDLSMEQLQKNSLVVNRAMLQETRNLRYLQASSLLMQSLAQSSSRSFRCTSSNYGGYTYTNCY